MKLKVQTVAERRKKMIQWRAKGATYEEIAKIFGVTRQRVHQIIKSYPQSPSTTFDKQLTRD